MCGIAACAAPATRPPNTASSESSELGVGSIDQLGLSVRDLAASERFFIDALGFRVRGRDDEYPAVFLTNDRTTITLWQADAGAREFDRRANIGLHHVALGAAIFEALDALHETIAAYPGVEIEFAPELAYGGPARHMMFREPSGNRIEIVHRPAEAARNGE